MTADPTGEEVAEARQRRGWTQRDLAARLRVSVETVSNRETGQVRRLKNREALLRALLFDQAPDRVVPDLRSATDRELLAELSRRAAVRDSHGDDGTRV